MARSPLDQLQLRSSLYEIAVHKRMPTIFGGSTVPYCKLLTVCVRISYELLAVNRAYIYLQYMIQKLTAQVHITFLSNTPHLKERIQQIGQGWVGFRVVQGIKDKPWDDGVSTGQK